jgi:hypothetical protein
MTVPLIIYLVEVLDKISCALTFVFILSVVGAVIAFGAWSFNADMTDYGDKYAVKAASAKKILKSIVIAMCVTAILDIIIPSKKTIYLMIGGYAAESIYESPEAKAFGNKVLNIVNNKLDEIEQSTKTKEKK